VGCGRRGVDPGDGDRTPESPLTRIRLPGPPPAYRIAFDGSCFAR
jgi:hypothetical protein